jgi:hypothetical protein
MCAAACGAIRGLAGAVVAGSDETRVKMRASGCFDYWSNRAEDAVNLGFAFLRKAFDNFL